MIKRDYPYMYARISAKRSRLLEREDYERMVKMGPSEIARNLEEGDYEKDINELGSKYSGVELVELALMRNVSRTMREIIDISPESLDPLINTFLRRFDILSIKRLLRWKKGGEKGNIEDLLVPVGYYSIEGLMNMSEKTLGEICESIRFPNSSVDYQDRICDLDDLREIEKELDRAYFEELKQMKEEIDSIWFKRFIRNEMEYDDMKIALRLKKYGEEPGEIEEWLVSGESFDSVEKIIEAENLEEAVQTVVEMKDVEVKGEKTLERVEHSLEIERLKSALASLHLEPLGITSIFGYIVAKMIEVKNLRMLIRAKETNIQNLETIKSNIVMA